MGTWPVVQARAWARERLANAGIDSVDADVRELLEWACDVTSQLDLPAALDPEQADKLRGGVGERALRIPLQHVTGRMYFRSLTLRSVPGVFVVRPETEVLAGLAIDEAAAAVAARGEARLVDLCTGSGAIALAVATESARTEVWAVEKEPDPFVLACLNRDRVGACGVHLVRGDATHPATLGFLDGLIDRRSLTLLRPGGTLLMEHSPSQDEALRTYAASLGMVEVSTSTDLAGRMRFLRACAPR